MLAGIQYTLKLVDKLNVLLIRVANYKQINKLHSN